MSDVDDKDLDELEEEPIVVMTDEEGNEYFYREEMIIPIDDKKFAILVPIDMDDECECDDEECDDEECDCHLDDMDVFIARVDVDASGEEIYVDPTDEEFEAVRKAYEELFEDEEAE